MNLFSNIENECFNWVLNTRVLSNTLIQHIGILEYKIGNIL